MTDASADTSTPIGRSLPTAAASTGSPASDAEGAVELSRDVRERLPSHDPAALEAFFDLYFDRVFGYLRRLVREEHLAEDLTQDVFLHVHRSLPGYDPSRPLSPWVYTIATNKVRDLWRSRRHQEDRRQLSTDDDDRSVAAVSDGLVDGRGVGPADGLESSETERQVAEAVESLPEMLRATFVLRYYEGLSFEEIGAMVDRNETAVRKRYSRALQELRGALAPLLDS